MSSNGVSVFEVGPRDGLQNETQVLSTEAKLSLIDDLLLAGVREMETGAFVRPDRVPQMGDSDQIARTLASKRDGHYAQADFYYLVPNLKGYERLKASGARAIALFTAVSDSFNQKNIGMSVQDSLNEMKEIAERAVQDGLKVRGYVSTVWGCPFEGRMSVSKAEKVLAQVLSLPIQELSVGDTIGVAAPRQVKELLKVILPISNQIKKPIAVHFHDTRGTALANAAASLDLGVTRFDSSLGGLGGCPFAPGASGNLATEDLVYFLKEVGMNTGINYAKLCRASVKLFQALGNRPPRSKALQAFLANENKNTPWDT